MKSEKGKNDAQKMPFSAKWVKNGPNPEKSASWNKGIEDDRKF
jgi:hypothetical protein